eukprot:GGOE01045385.1.p1 GENE.GGOE01045385.1~~GGOE01045385.1.p1  ORF type:complete len:374 (-),score=29.36 GGOE01045385.1:305-1426(-)
MTGSQVAEDELGSEEEEVASSKVTPSPKSATSQLLGMSHSGRSGWSAAPPTSTSSQRKGSAGENAEGAEITLMVPAELPKAATPVASRATKTGDKPKPSHVRSPGGTKRSSQRSLAPATGNVDRGQARHDDAPQPHSTSRSLHEPIINRDSPGPTYLPTVDCCKARSTAPLFGSGPRFGPELKGHQLTAAVPMYRLEEQWTSKPATISKSPRFRPSPQGEFPAPTDYMPDHNVIKRTVPAVKIFQQPRDAVAPIRPETPSRGNPSTGPLATKPNPRKKRGRKVIGGPLNPSAPCTFGIAYAAKPLAVSSLPGPGAYHKPSDLGQKGLGGTLFKSGRVMEVHERDYEAEPGLYNPSIEAVRPRAPAPMCYLTSS